MLPRSLHAVQTAVDVDGIRTWRTTVILIMGKTWRPPMWAPYRDENGAGSGNSLVYLWSEGSKLLCTHCLWGDLNIGGGTKFKVWGAQIFEVKNGDPIGRVQRMGWRRGCLRGMCPPQKLELFWKYSLKWSDLVHYFSMLSACLLGCLLL